MQKIVVLTGAGMSAESGISTFRDSDGLWEKHRIEDVATPEAWQHNPELVHEFYNQRRKQLLTVVPNSGHLALADLEKDYEVKIITQNVDNLHERAGSTWILHLHGELMKMRSTSPMEDVFDVNPLNKMEYFSGDLCPRAEWILFQHARKPSRRRRLAGEQIIVRKADRLLMIGTSLQVYPAAGLINFAQSNIPIYLIDPNDIKSLPSRVIVIRKGASDGIRELIEKYLKINC